MPYVAGRAARCGIGRWRCWVSGRPNVDSGIALAEQWSVQSTLGSVTRPSNGVTPSWWVADRLLLSDGQTMCNPSGMSSRCCCGFWGADLYIEFLLLCWSAIGQLAELVGITVEYSWGQYLDGWLLWWKAVPGLERGVDTDEREGQPLCGETAAGCEVTEEGNALCDVGIPTKSMPKLGFIQHDTTTKMTRLNIPSQGLNSD
jgi:hypothetical protein